VEDRVVPQSRVGTAVVALHEVGTKADLGDEGREARLAAAPLVRGPSAHEVGTKADLGDEDREERLAAAPLVRGRGVRGSDVHEVGTKADLGDEGREEVFAAPPLVRGPRVHEVGTKADLGDEGCEELFLLAASRARAWTEWSEGDERTRGEAANDASFPSFPRPAFVPAS
jgi:hypothetical protein